MAEIKDLDQCNYFPVDCPSLIAIGWLGAASDFERGPVGEEFFLKLRELARAPWQPVASPGFHLCEFCQFEPPGFSAAVFIPYDGRIYVAPGAIAHYVAAHWYRPPQVFIDAVMACPPMRGMDYYKALVRCGGKMLLALKDSPDA